MENPLDVEGTDVAATGAAIRALLPVRMDTAARY
jgi:hypothetical protein